ncbi:hypothetical protein M409DRAFT_18653 [Zasmidium cellare ATCC 36951]|uniref:Uncharacterized protein n=1 Tax=Zasmidium cellare ATCC 36951 TaxID=1080233 RepID=A0A6A6CWQ1_ZASCE|nr:uncharacterized protein M409DRAFT_18653 [Zasmidium cellare ATCC 36951]KAF2171541.1 hypothetical protein M409DRAFT_18653 [Zasmidium cellare ATCC 36951]
MATDPNGDTKPYSETRKIRLDLEDYSHDRWGFVMYRTTYGDDDAWEQLKKIVKERAREQLLASTGPYLLDSLDWKFFDDQEASDNASVANLRQHFTAWIRDNWQLEQPRGTCPGSPRYRLFIRVDREALDSVLDRNNVRFAAPWADAGWVHLISGEWESELDHVDPDDEYDQPDLTFNPVEDCREQDVGWMKVPAEEIGFQMYSRFVNPDSWYILYERPPKIAFWT